MKTCTLLILQSKHFIWNAYKMLHITRVSPLICIGSDQPVCSIL